MLLIGSEGVCAVHQEKTCLLLFLYLRRRFIRDSLFICIVAFECSHPEFLFDGAGVGLRVQAVHVIVDRTELTSGNGGVAAETCLQNGVVDEDILLLQKTASSLRICQTCRTHLNGQHSRSSRNAGASVPLHFCENNSMTFPQPHRDFSLPPRQFP